MICRIYVVIYPHAYCILAIIQLWPTSRKRTPPMSGKGDMVLSVSRLGSSPSRVCPVTGVSINLGTRLRFDCIEECRKPKEIWTRAIVVFYYALVIMSFVHYIKTTSAFVHNYCSVTYTVPASSHYHLSSVSYWVVALVSARGFYFALKLHSITKGAGQFRLYCPSSIP